MEDGSATGARISPLADVAALADVVCVASGLDTHNLAPRRARTTRAHCGSCQRCWWPFGRERHRLPGARQARIGFVKLESVEAQPQSMLRGGGRRRRRRCHGRSRGWRAGGMPPAGRLTLPRGAPAGQLTLCSNAAGVLRRMSLYILIKIKAAMVRGNRQRPNGPIRFIGTRCP
jgi:hypothetical protein